MAPELEGKLPDLTEAQRAAISALSKDDAVIAAPVWLAQRAHVPNDAIERQFASQDPDGFWREKAKLVDWMKPFEQVTRFEPPRHEWFVGGKLNATVNCIDRHVFGDRRLKAALIWVGEDGEEHTYTYNRLYREVNRFANALKKLGVRKGDRVLLYMPLTPEGIISMLACARIGAIHSVVFAGMGTQALRSRIEDCAAKVVVCSDYTYRRGKKVPLKPTVDEAVRDLYGVEHVIVHRRGSRPGDAPFTFESEREHDFYDIQDGHAIHCPPEPMDSEDPLFILYTSGTTGKPKGVVHTTGGYLVGTTYLARAYYQITDSDIYWSTSDIGWIVGHSFIVYGPLSAGATIFTREGVPDYPSPDVTWELCERYGVNVMFTAPTAVRMWMSHGGDAPSRYDLQKLRLIACAGEPLNPEAHRWAQANLVGQSKGMVVDNWWQTEIAAPVLGTLPTFDARPGKVGKPVPGADVAVVDAAGKPVSDGEGGLLVIRKPLPYMLRTIWNDHARYEKYWSQIPGVYTAGDIAVRDRDGYFAVLGRADDVMNVAGHRIGTADVESALLRHPAVAESAVIGLPDPVKGEKIKAFVVLRKGVPQGPGLVASLKDHVRQDLGPIATPADVELRASLPKTRSGKIMRRLLKAVEMGQDPGDVSTMAD
ncbi:acetate--CoA ligase [Anaeromyxobacter sp. Fw109-5]|uniref:acetate--CoA ligase n=1 Tax=Anaeromyxobacter sp. (strain Fw109-5) TaxID=404589 RepID=UPI0000ED81BA|nr:acetate--CoA ligase [Anaeromyxobacter sp. Fw109-5]ABS25970.1 AMP-dependent synthetase and ligase [Anaeromyxobacter sp. Fw109-5]